MRGGRKTKSLKVRMREVRVDPFISLLNGCIYFFILAQPHKDGEELRDEGRKENQEPQGEDEGGEC